MSKAQKEEKRNKYIIAPLEKERDDLITEVNIQIDHNRKSNEQINLLRFKVEVLLQMLAIEEKKFETTAARLDALKWAVANNCLEIADASHQSNASTASMHAKADGCDVNRLDIAGAMGRMWAEFQRCSENILIKFADEKGEITPSLSKQEFVNTLLTITSTRLSLADIEVLHNI